MCGIFGYTGSVINVGSLCFKALKKLEYRGYDSWGIAAIGDSLEVIKETGKLPESAYTMKPGRMVIGHSRWATHGGVTLENTHPHISMNRQAALVHNGVVENHKDLKKLLISLGYKFISETDSEIIVQLYEHTRQTHDPISALKETASLLQGNNAIVIMDIPADLILATKKGSPIVLGKGRECSYIASDVIPLLESTDLFYYPDDNELLVLDKEKIFVRKRDGDCTLLTDFKKVSLSYADAELGSYPHFLLKEVHEQPGILRRIALLNSDDLRRMRKFLNESSDLWFVACGTAFNAGLLATYFAARVGRCARAVYAHELPMLLGQIKDTSRVIALSQSGETIDVADAVLMLKNKGIMTAALLNVPESTVSRMVEEVLFLGAGPEICVLSTKAFSAMVANLYALYSLDDNYRGVLLDAADAMSSMLCDEMIAQIEKLADEICKSDSLFIIGAGEYYPLALEAALKIKEVSYIHAEAFASGELKHGVIALIEEGTPCLVFSPGTSANDRTLIHASEIRARGGRIISCSPEPLDWRDEHIKIEHEGMSFLFSALAFVQLLAYKCACKKNLDPDKPRNLAKSVTVR